MGDEPVTWPCLRRTTHKRRINADRHPCLEWDSNPRSQCLSVRRHFVPFTTRSLWSAKWNLQNNKSRMTPQETFGWCLSYSEWSEAWKCFVAFAFHILWVHGYKLKYLKSTVTIQSYIHEEINSKFNSDNTRYYSVQNRLHSLPIKTWILKK
jgi:hypothetical protein